MLLLVRTPAPFLPAPFVVLRRQDKPVSRLLIIILVLKNLVGLPLLVAES